MQTAYGLVGAYDQAAEVGEGRDVGGDGLIIVGIGGELTEGGGGGDSPGCGAVASCEGGGGGGDGHGWLLASVDARTRGLGCRFGTKMPRGGRKSGT